VPHGSLPEGAAAENRLDVEASVSSDALKTTPLLCYKAGMASVPADDRAAELTRESVSQTSVELRRADTLHQADPYGLQLKDADREFLDAVLGDRSLHNAIGFLVAAMTIPEPIDWDDCVEELNAFGQDLGLDYSESLDEVAFDEAEIDALDEDKSDALDQDEIDALDEDESDELDEDEGDFDEGDLEEDADGETPSTLTLEIQRVLSAVRDHVVLRIADGAVASLIPIAEDTEACDEWIDGFELGKSQTLHDPSDEEATISLRVCANLCLDETVTRAESKANARKTLAADVTRLIELWREVPPYDLEQEALRWSTEVPKKKGDVALQERVIHSGGTFVRAEAKVGRNDLCPCGSGKKYKKCCA
jgi:hypothetical protein